MARNKRPPSSDQKVHDAVRHVWENAGYNHPVDGIVPLYELIGGYLIWTREIPRLSQREAGLFLTRKISSRLALAMDDPAPLSGFLFAQKTGDMDIGCILVDSSDVLARRRFSAAHELGHYVMHFLSYLKSLDATYRDEIIATEGLVYGEPEGTETTEPVKEYWGAQPVTPGVEVAENVMLFTEPWQETEANRFASELLIPEETCRRLIERSGAPFERNRDSVIRRLAASLLVSKEAITWRLSGLGL